MTIRTKITFQILTPRDKRKPTIAEALADRLGREPTHAELCAEVKRILQSAWR